MTRGEALSKCNLEPLGDHQASDDILRHITVAEGGRCLAVKVSNTWVHCKRNGAEI